MAIQIVGLICFLPLRNKPLFRKQQQQKNSWTHRNCIKQMKEAIHNHDLWNSEHNFSVKRDHNDDENEVKTLISLFNFSYCDTNTLKLTLYMRICI